MFFLLAFVNCSNDVRVTLPCWLKAKTMIFTCVVVVSNGYDYHQVKF